MIRIAQAIRDQAEELATLESRDNGKPLRQARTDVQVAARYFEFFAGIADKIMGNTIPLGPGFLDYTVREPIGVSAQIIPWNYPIQIGARGVAPALAAGCTVVLKPAEDAPMTALRLGEIALACGLPAGVLNVAARHRDRRPAPRWPAIPASISSRSPDRCRVGIAVAKMAADNVVPVVMELGGKSPNIVFADADLDLTVQGVANAIFQNAGQTCSAGSRLLVQRKAHDELVARLTERAKAMRVGPGRQRSGHGPDHLEEAARDDRRLREDRRRAKGRSVAAGGGRPSGSGRSDDGFFFQPTLLDGVSPDMRVAQEEIFGPVLAIIAFDDVEEAIAIANRSQYGLVAGVWTRDINKAMARRVADQGRARSTSTPTAPAAASSCRSADTRRAATAARRASSRSRATCRSRTSA